MIGQLAGKSLLLKVVGNRHVNSNGQRLFGGLADIVDQAEIGKPEMDKAMQEHTYAIMNDVEDKHWWFVGRRAILEMFMKGIVSSKFKVQSSKFDNPDSGDQVQSSKEQVQSSKEQVQSSKNEESSGLEKRLEPNETNLEPGTRNLEPNAQNFEPSSLLELRILDVGCGTGANLEMLEQFGRAEGVDVSDDALEFCRAKGLKVHKGLAEELPFEDGAFDVVTALDVVEHLDDDVAGLKEMNRVLRSGGKALFFVPAFMWLWGVQDDISNHRIRYTRKQIVERLESAGFVTERATYANITFFAPILGGRLLMKLTGLKPESENNINVSALNGIFGKIFSAEQYWLKKANFPFGVSIVVAASKP